MNIRFCTLFLACFGLFSAPNASAQDKAKPAAAKPAPAKTDKPATGAKGTKDETGKKPAAAKATVVPAKAGADADASAPAAAAPPKKKSKKIRVTWLGHAAFEIVSGEGTTVLIDPFLSQNPATPADRKKLDAYKPDAILVSHGHPDHLGDAVAISRKTGAPVIGSHDLVTSLKLKDDRKRGGNVGGKHVVKDIEIHLVPAMHGSAPGGRPVGFVLKFSTGQVVYHTGDTWIFGDMALINEIHKPKIVLMNCGGGPYTQDPKTCALTTKKYFKKAKTIIPMHFGTFPPLATEADIVKAMKKHKKKLKVLKPGESIELKK